MRKALQAVALAFLCAFSFVPEDAAASESAYTTARLRLREEPSVTAGILATLPKGKRLTVFACSNDWCQASYNFLSGYVSESYLSKAPPAPAPRTRRSGHGYINSRGEWVPSPAWTADGRPPSGASAQC